MVEVLADGVTLSDACLETLYIIGALDSLKAGFFELEVAPV